MNSMFLAALLIAAMPPFEVQTLDGKTLTSATWSSFRPSG